MSDLNRLNEIHEECGKLEKTIKDHADLADGLSNESEQNEWRVSWDAMNADYDKLAEEAEQIQNSLAAKENIQNRLDALQEASNQRNAQKPGRSQADLDMTPPKTLSEFETATRNWIGNQALALHAWHIYNSGPEYANLMTDEHRDAVKMTNAQLYGNQFNLKLMPTHDFLAYRSNWLYNGGRMMNAQLEGTPSKGGILVGETLLSSIEKAMLDFSGVLQVADVIRTSNGEPFRWPTVNDTSNKGTLVGESADAGTATDIALGRVTWYAETFTSGLLYVSRDLLQDSIVNFERVVGELLGERIGRKQNEVYTTGSGAGIVPRGIVTDSILGVTTTSSSAIAFDEVYDLENAIDPSYLSGATFMMHRSIINVIRKLKDGNGQYLWSRGTQAGTPDMLIGYPVRRNQDMASAITSGAKTVLFGDLSKYKVRQVNDVRMQRLVETRAEYNQDAFIAYARGDGKLLDAGTNPVKHMTH